jgi:hypothetical protein
MSKENFYKKFNDFIGDKFSFALSTMEMFWLVLVLVLLPLLFQHPDTLISWIQYLSTAVLQAVALPLLGYTTKKSGESQEKIIKDTHDILMNELKEAKEIRKQQLNMMKEIKQIHEHYHQELVSKTKKK